MYLLSGNPDSYSHQQLSRPPYSGDKAAVLRRIWEMARYYNRMLTKWPFCHCKFKDMTEEGSAAAEPGADCDGNVWLGYCNMIFYD